MLTGWYFSSFRREKMITIMHSCYEKWWEGRRGCHKTGPLLGNHHLHSLPNSNLKLLISSPSLTPVHLLVWSPCLIFLCTTGRGPQRGFHRHRRLFVLWKHAMWTKGCQSFVYIGEILRCGQTKKPCLSFSRASWSPRTAQQSPRICAEKELLISRSTNSHLMSIPAPGRRLCALLRSPISWITGFQVDLDTSGVIRVRIVGSVD